jgi:hypothetical protein
MKQTSLSRPSFNDVALMAAPNMVLKMVLSTTNVLLLSQSDLTISSTDLQKRQEPSGRVIK